MIRPLLLILLIGTIAGCATIELCEVESESMPVTDQYEQSNRIDSIVSPYREELKDEMQEVIAHSANDLTKGRPNGVLNNWAADAVQSRHKKLVDGPVFTLLNVGGLRNPISAGDVTIGDIYKLMPFDNMVVCVEMPWDTWSEIESYLMRSGGEPISGVEFKNGELTFVEDIDHTPSFWILTSDYLLNGGDNMRFFEKNFRVIETNELLRETFLNVAKEQKELLFPDDTRIYIER